MAVGVAGTILKRDRVIVVAGLGGIIALAWAYVVYLARDMSNMTPEMSMPNMQVWGTMDFVLMFVMWAVMMVAMMTPSAAPMILMHSSMERRRHADRNPYQATAIFLLGYLMIWTAFSAAATLAQWGLHTAALLSPMMVSTSPILGGILLIGAGAFQFTPLKHACLSSCRSPLGFFMTEWREGRRGTLVMGLRHGSLCMGCCWLMMALLFVAGVMNLLWVAAIAAYVLVEKVAPAGHWVSRAIGLVVIGWGVWMLAGALW